MPNGWSRYHSNEPKGIRVYVAGARGMVGSALGRRLQGAGYTLVQPAVRVDLRDQKATHELIEDLKPDWVFLAAAKVGGIYANKTYPAEFIYDNLMIQSNVIHASHQSRVKKLLLLGSSCIYPKFAPQPLREEYLLSGELEPTNEPYAVAKIAAIVMARSYNRQYGTDFLCVMPTNLYGPNDNFDLQTSHVVAALIRKTHEAKVSGAEFVEVWGTGTPLREFLHVDDMTDACLFLMEREETAKLVNIGYGSDISVRDLALLIKDIAGYEGEIRFNPEMPDGTPRKLLDTTLLTSLGWKPSIPLREGLTAVYRWYVENADWQRR
ncbi:MAG: GDP-L-fucose synthase [Desulfomonile tiedjei]|nr:GDP-L-fucose synthase [Desulfomonile tiedjei]